MISQNAILILIVSEKALNVKDFQQISAEMINQNKYRIVFWMKVHGRSFQCRYSIQRLAQKHLHRLYISRNIDKQTAAVLIAEFPVEMLCRFIHSCRCHDRAISLPLLNLFLEFTF